MKRKNLDVNFDTSHKKKSNPFSLRKRFEQLIGNKRIRGQIQFSSDSSSNEQMKSRFLFIPSGGFIRTIQFQRECSSKRRSSRGRFDKSRVVWISDCQWNCCHLTYSILSLWGNLILFAAINPHFQRDYRLWNHTNIS